MATIEFGLEMRRLHAPVPVHHAALSADAWQDALTLARVRGARLVSLWAADRRPIDGAFAVHCALAESAGLVWLSLPVPADRPLVSGDR